MSGTSRFVLALAFVTSAAAYAVSAKAYCRVTTCDLKKGTCPKDQHGCDTKGAATQWSGGSVTLSVDQDGSVLRDLPGADTEAAVDAALLAWTSADCPGGGHPALHVKTDLVSGLHAGFNPSGQNQSVVLYQDGGWPYEADAVAKTTLGFRSTTGDILDADLEINSTDYPFTLNPVEPADVDLLAVLTHEIGHFLGLAHSDVPGATMQPEAQGFATPELETLEQDDMDGICAIYPPRAGTPRKEPVPSPDDTAAGPAPRGCSLAPNRGRSVPSRVPVTSALLGVGLAFRRARRKRYEAFTPETFRSE